MWTTQQAALLGVVEESDRLANVLHEACRTCGCAFESVTLELDELPFADADDVEALATYCREVTIGGGRISIRTARPTLRRLLKSGPVSGFVADNSDDEPGFGQPYDCPHRP